MGWAPIALGRDVEAEDALVARLHVENWKVLRSLRGAHRLTGAVELRELKRHEAVGARRSLVVRPLARSHEREPLQGSNPRMASQRRLHEARELRATHVHRAVEQRAYRLQHLQRPLQLRAQRGRDLIHATPKLEALARLDARAERAEQRHRERHAEREQRERPTMRSQTAQPRYTRGSLHVGAVVHEVARNVSWPGAI